MSDDDRRTAGGSAFPTFGYGGGMTMRDYFAAHAAAGELASQSNGEGVLYDGPKGAAQVAEWAYLVADAMLAARTTKPTA